MSVELLCECFSVDEADTERLVTTALEQFEPHTCLTLALATNHEVYVAHSSVQSHLDQEWMGKIKEKQWLVVKCLIGIIFPMYIQFITFKNKIVFVRQSEKSERTPKKM